MKCVLTIWSSESFHECCDVLRDNRMTMVVIDQDGELAEFVLAMTRRLECWRTFAWRHPILGARIILQEALRKRFLGGVKKDETADEALPITKWLADSASQRSWNDSEDQIAKIHFIDVGRRFRQSRRRRREVPRGEFAGMQGRRFFSRLTRPVV